MVDIDQVEEQLADATLTPDNPEVGDDNKAIPPEELSPVTRLLQALFGKSKQGQAAPAPTSAASEAQATVDDADSEDDAYPQYNPDDPPKLPSGALMTVVTRNEFYRDGFRQLLWIAFFETIALVLVVMVLFYYMTSSEAEDRYFATTADGRIMRLVPLGQPNMQTAALLSWVSQASSEVMTFSFHDYQRRLQQSSRHFTRRGWETFTDALQKSHILKTVQDHKQVVSAVPRAAPVLIQQGVFQGKYRWIVRLPLQVNYEGKSKRTDYLDLKLVIERVPALENPHGVGIEQWIAEVGG